MLNDWLCADFRTLLRVRQFACRLRTSGVRWCHDALYPNIARNKSIKQLYYSETHHITKIQQSLCLSSASSSYTPEKTDQLMHFYH